MLSGRTHFAAVSNQAYSTMQTTTSCIPKHVTGRYQSCQHASVNLWPSIIYNMQQQQRSIAGTDHNVYDDRQTSCGVWKPVAQQCPLAIKNETSTINNSCFPSLPTANDSGQQEKKLVHQYIHVLCCSRSPCATLSHIKIVKSQSRST